MRSRLAAVGSFCLVLLGPGAAAADRLVVYGPAGTGAERRALVVVQRDDGTCAPWTGLTAAADEPGVTVALEDAEGACARWVAIQASPPRAQITLRVRGVVQDSRVDPGPRARTSRRAVETAVAVAMGSDRGLELQATRSGRHVRVRVTGAPPEEEVRVTAFWEGGQAALVRARGSRDDFTGEAPTDRIVGLVARSGSLVGADAVAGEGPDAGSAALVVPSALAVPAGASVRTAAFVIVTDGRGRLSRSVPLRIVSRRGRLRSLTWVEDGVAAVGLSAPAGTSSIDLSAWTLSEASARTLEIPSVADWPAHGALEVPRSTPHGDRVPIVLTASTLEGLAVSPDRLRVACDSVPAERDEGGGFTCAAPADDRREIVVVASAVVDDQTIPLAQVSAAIEPAPPPPPPAPPAPVAPVRRRARAPARSVARVAPAAVALVGIDGSGAAAWGAGLRTDLAIGATLFLTTAARYTGARIDAAPAGALHDGLVGARHAAELQAGAGLRGRVFGVRFAGAATFGPSWLFTDAAIGATAVQAPATRLIGQASAGPRARLGSLAVGIDLGVRVIPWSSEQTWREPVATAFLEVMGGAAID
jgi:hypothetical protein